MKETLVSSTHSFDIEEAKRLGSIEKAIILKEIRQMLAYKIRHEKEPWVYYSKRGLSEKFPYMTESSIDRWMRELENDGELISKVRNKFKWDKTKSYTVPNLEGSIAQNELSTTQNEPTIPSLSTSLSHTGATIVAQGKSINKSKEVVLPHNRKVFEQDIDSEHQPMSSSVKKKKFTPDVEAVYFLFGNPYPLNWRKNTTELGAAKNLITEHGLKAVENALGFYKENKDDQYCPEILTPNDLDKKWRKLVAYKQKNA